MFAYKMGRKAKFDEETIVQKRGPGRKTKKQKDPTFDKKLTGKCYLYINFSTHFDNYLN